MALTADQLQAQLDALRKARYSGVLTVRHGDTQTTFKSDADMGKAIAALENELGAATGTGPLRQIRLNSCKGL